MKRFFILILTLLLLCTMVACGDNTGDEGSNGGNGGDGGSNGGTSGEFVTTHKATIEIKNYGTIELDLYGEEAPITVTNFTRLANSGFYNGLTFHRIIEGFMMQGGCPNGNGTGDSDLGTIKGEFTSNNVNNRILHKRGVISMARSGHQYYDYYYYDSASCQFFIMHDDNESLDGKYASFGMVTKGMDVVDKVCENARPIDNNGSIAKEAQPIIEAIKVVCVSDKFQEKTPFATHEAVIEIEDYGTIKLDLYGEVAPITVSNFEKLASEGFYNGLTFHRIMKDFMMQGGCPDGDGTGDSGTDIKGEFLSNGVNNTIWHKRGVISMARGNEYDSGSCQFFIVHKDSFFLDYNYAAFGVVTSGMDVVDRVCESAEPTDSNGKIPKEKQPVIKSITITKK